MSHQTAETTVASLGFVQSLWKDLKKTVQIPFSERQITIRHFMKV